MTPLVPTRLESILLDFLPIQRESERRLALAAMRPILSAPELSAHERRLHESGERDSLMTRRLKRAFEAAGDAVSVIVPPILVLTPSEGSTPESRLSAALATETSPKLIVLTDHDTAESLGANERFMMAEQGEAKVEIHAVRAALAPLEELLGRKTQETGTTQDLWQRHHREGLIGEILDDRYEVLREIHEARWGVMLDAWEQISGRRCGLLILAEPPKKKNDRPRLERWSSVVSRMTHESLLRVAKMAPDKDGSKTQPMLVVDLARGERLTEYCARDGDVSSARLRSWTEEILELLVAFEEASEGRDSIAFGLDPSVAWVQETGSLKLLGTGFVSDPEPTKRDLEILGTIIANLLAGRSPESSEPPEDRTKRHRSFPGGFLERCVGSSAESFTTAKEALDTLRGAGPKSGRPLAKAAGLAVLVATISFVGWELWQRRGQQGPEQNPQAVVEAKSFEWSLETVKRWKGREPLEFKEAYRGEAFGSWAIVQLDDEGEKPLAGWTLSSPSNGTLTLQGTLPEGRSSYQVKLRRVVDGEPPKDSGVFELVTLGPGSLGLDVRLEGLDRESLDPNGRELLIEVQGDNADIQSVGVRAFGKDTPASLLEGPSTTYGVPLSSFPFESGVLAELDVILVDRAGQTHQRTLSLTPMLDALELSAKVEGDQLIVELSHKADIRWTCFDATGEREIGADRGEGQSKYVFDVPQPIQKEGDEQSEARVFEVEAFDHRYVARRDPRAGLARERWTHTPEPEVPVKPPIIVEPERPEPERRIPVLEARIQAPDGSGPKALDPDEIIFSREGNLEVFATPVEGYTLSLSQRARWEAVRQVIYAERNEAGDATFPLRLDREGLYEIRLRARPLAGEGALPFEETYQLVIDVVPPDLSTDDDGSAVVVTKASEPFWFEASDASTRNEGEVKLTWTLERLDVTEGDVLPAPPGVASAQERVSTRRLLEPSWPLEDGRYRWSVTAEDEAGNISTTRTIDVDLARHGPTAEVLEQDVPWTRNRSGGPWTLRVKCASVHGVKSVEAHVRGDMLDEPEVWSLERDATRDIYIGDGVFSEGGRVQIEVRAVDGYDVLSTHSFEAEVDWSPPHPVTVAGRDGAAMILVAGNREPYVFGGREDEIESALMEGLSDYQPINRDIIPAGGIRFFPGDIEDFYLDREEVSRRDYLRFVVAADGYARVFNDETRRAELQARLSSKGDLPATGLDWEEAQAYATWTSKRLPSWVEWEFAVRDGTRYLPFANAGQEDAPLAINLEGRGEGLWSAGRGGDLSSHGIRNLCGNVAEWTSSPQGTESGFVSDWMLRDRLAAVSPLRRIGWDLAEQYWVVGGSIRGGRFEFNTVRTRLREARSGTIGFRCALSASDRERHGFESLED